MTTTRAAKYLNGADIGKKFSIQDGPAPRKILDIRHYSSRTEVSCFDPAIGTIVKALVLPEEEVTIYTPPSPPTDDPHGLNTKQEAPASTAGRRMIRDYRVWVKATRGGKTRRFDTSVTANSLQEANKQARETLDGYGYTDIKILSIRKEP